MKPVKESVNQDNVCVSTIDARRQDEIERKAAEEFATPAAKPIEIEPE